MKRLTGFACLLTAAAAGLAGWLALGGAHELPMAPIQTDKADTRLVAQGAYLAKAGDCAACHTASPGQSFAGGVALATPFGTITSTNITPDPQTGIGLWSEAAFSRALRQGIARDGHQLYPAMPYTAYTRLSDADIHALKAYFDSLAPIRHANQPSQLRFPFNIRPLLRLWNILFFTDKRFQAAPDRSPEWNRGAYLVEGAGHCGSCHTGKNPLGGDKEPLQGGALLGWYAPELSRNPHVGLGQWSITGTMDYLKTGRSPLALANGPMAEVVEKSTSLLSETDLRAIAVYITGRAGSDRTLPAPLASTDMAWVNGRDLFQRHCAACHGSSGEGVHAMVPRLARVSGIVAPDPASLIRTVLSGGQKGTRMPGFAGRLDDGQIADILTYIRNDWGNAATPVPRRAVTSSRDGGRA